MIIFSAVNFFSRDFSTVSITMSKRNSFLYFHQYRYNIVEQVLFTNIYYVIIMTSL